MLGQRPLDRVPVTHVCLAGRDRLARLGCRAGGAGVDVERVDGGPCLGESEHDLAAEPAARAGDDGGFAVEPEEIDGGQVA